jgi:chitin disaccharide deacetylase
MSGKTTNAMLGYPDDARLLIVNCDDFGMSHAGNAATLPSLTEGLATSTSLMAPCPWAHHGIVALRDHPEIPFGVHLTLVRDFGVYRWGPLASRERVPSLVDAGGYLWPNDRNAELLARARIDEVEVEFRAQIDAVLAEGLRPTHLDFHCLPDGGRADIFDLSIALARAYGLALRAHDTANAARLRDVGLPTVDHGVLDSYRLDPATKAETYAALLRELPPGLSEWAVHPSLGTDEARALEPETWRIRRADYDFLVSPEARETVVAEGIVLLDYGALQPRWAG